jgi:hypothetical protein
MAARSLRRRRLGRDAAVTRSPRRCSAAAVHRCESLCARPTGRRLAANSPSWTNQLAWAIESARARTGPHRAGGPSPAEPRTGARGKNQAPPAHPAPRPRPQLDGSAETGLPLSSGGTSGPRARGAPPTRIRLPPSTTWSSPRRGGRRWSLQPGRTISVRGLTWKTKAERPTLLEVLMPSVPVPHLYLPREDIPKAPPPARGSASKHATRNTNRPAAHLEHAIRRPAARHASEAAPLSSARRCPRRVVAQRQDEDSRFSSRRRPPMTRPPGPAARNGTVRASRRRRRLDTTTPNDSALGETRPAVGIRCHPSGPPLEEDRERLAVAD